MVGTPDNTFILSREPRASWVLFLEKSCTRVSRQPSLRTRVQRGHLTAVGDHTRGVVGGIDTCLLPRVCCIAGKHAQMSGASTRMTILLLSLAQLGYQNSWVTTPPPLKATSNKRVKERDFSTFSQRLLAQYDRLVEVLSDGRLAATVLF